VEVRTRCAHVRQALTDRDHTSAGVLTYIEKSGATFLRPGARRLGLFTAAEFSAHLQAKAVLQGFSLTRPAAEFIKELASTSTLHGTAYRVRLPDGTERDVKEWLAERFARQP